MARGGLWHEVGLVGVPQGWAGPKEAEELHAGLNDVPEMQHWPGGNDMPNWRIGGDGGGGGGGGDGDGGGGDGFGVKDGGGGGGGGDGDGDGGGGMGGGGMGGGGDGMGGGDGDGTQRKNSSQLLLQARTADL